MRALHVVAAPTGTRGSILLMTGGLIVLGFLFLALLFRSSIVGDLAPVANARAPTPRVILPPTLALPPSRALPGRPFERGRELGREAERRLDAALDHLRAQGADARLLRSGPATKHVRLYACVTCASVEGKPRPAGSPRTPPHGCEFERGLLAGAFESLTAELATVQETSCAREGAAHCEFTIHHTPPLEVR